MVASEYQSYTGSIGQQLRVQSTRAISWGAVFAGVVIVLAIEVLLSMLGIGIGLSTVNPVEGTTPGASTLGASAGLWWGISYLVALVAGGYVAARLAAQRLTPLDAALHGILTWAFTLLVTFYLLSTAVGSVIGGAFSAVSGTLSGAAEGLKSAAPKITEASGVTPDIVQRTAKDLLTGQPTNADPNSLNAEQAEQEIAADLPKLAAGGDTAKQAHDQIVALMSAQLHISPDEANHRLESLQQKAQQTKDRAINQAKATADTAATGLSRASLFAFAALLMGAFAAAFGGYLGARYDRLARNPHIGERTPG